MLNWPLPSKGNRQEFFCTGGVWQPWNKPRGVDMVFIYCLGSGAGGGAGLTGASGTSRGGGGGGGSAASTRLLIPAALIPDQLYVQVPAGGAAGVNGGISYVSVL